MTADRDNLDYLLDASNPQLAPASAAVKAELVALANASRTASRRRVQRRVPKLAASGVLVAVMVGGVGAAAALSPPNWAPWADDPDYSYAFKVPSGAKCDFVLGNVSSDDPALTKAVRDYVSRTDVMGLADVNKALRENRVGEHNASDEDSQEVSPSRDVEFQMAVFSAVSKVIYEEMERQGWDVDNDDRDLAFDGQGYCGPRTDGRRSPGAQW